MVVNNQSNALVVLNTNSNITHSYWDTETSEQLTSAGGIGKTTSELQTGATGIYSTWSMDDWDFGTNSEYPGLIINGVVHRP